MGSSGGGGGGGPTGQPIGTMGTIQIGPPDDMAMVVLGSAIDVAPGALVDTYVTVKVLPETTVVTVSPGAAGGADVEAAACRGTSTAGKVVIGLLGSKTSAKAGMAKSHKKEVREKIILAMV
jgi:hypothetical protein